MKYRGATISFLDPGGDGPHAKDGYCTYKLPYEGKQYGQVLLLANGERKGAEKWAKDAIDQLLADLKAGKVLTVDG